MHRLASALRAAGIASTIAWRFLCPNIPAMLEAHYGVPAGGGILVAINIRLSTDEIGYILKHSGSKFLFVDAEFESMVKPARPHRAARWCEWTTPGAPGDPYEDFLGTGSPAPRRELAGGRGRDHLHQLHVRDHRAGPKGVMYSHRGAWVNAVGEVLEAGMGFDTRYLWTLPMFHCNGWCFTWGVTTVGGTHICLRRVESAPDLGAARVRSGDPLQRGAHRADRRGQPSARRTASRAR